MNAAVGMVETVETAEDEIVTVTVIAAVICHWSIVLVDLDVVKRRTAGSEIHSDQRSRSLVDYTHVVDTDLAVAVVRNCHLPDIVDYSDSTVVVDCPYWAVAGVGRFRSHHSIDHQY